MKKMLIITLALVVLVAALAGCASKAVQPETKPTQSIAVGEPTPGANPGTSAKIADKAIDAQGKLNGWIDENSIEIEINPEDTLAFRVTDVLEQLKGIEDGDMVKFSYEPNDNGQLIITKIEKVK